MLGKAVSGAVVVSDYYMRHEFVLFHWRYANNRMTNTSAKKLVYYPRHHEHLSHPWGDEDEHGNVGKYHIVRRGVRLFMCQNALRDMSSFILQDD